LVFLRFL